MLLGTRRTNFSKEYFGRARQAEHAVSIFVSEANPRGDRIRQPVQLTENFRKKKSLYSP